MNINSTSPEVLFGGQWQQLKARFLCGVGELDTANSSDFYGKTPSGYTIWPGETAGENLHTLSVQEMPAHNHVISGGAGNIYLAEGGKGIWLNQPTLYDSPYKTGVTNTGDNWSHNNMPPYFAVYMWKRIA